MPRLKDTYSKEIVPALMQKFGYKNVMQAPRLEKIVINMGMGDIKDNPKALDSALEELTNERYDTLNIIGGGSKNELLNELTAEYTGRKIVTGPTEGTAIGNFMMQMVGMGELSSVAEGRRIIKTSFDIREV